MSLSLVFFMIRVSQRQLEFLRCFGETLVPAGGGVAVGAKEADFVNRIGRLLAALPDGYDLPLRLLINGVDYLPAPTAGKFFSFRSSGARTRERTVAAWSESRIYLRRITMKVLKSLVYMSIYNDPVMHEAIGFRPHSSGRSRKKTGRKAREGKKETRTTQPVSSGNRKGKR